MVSIVIITSMKQVLCLQLIKVYPTFSLHWTVDYENDLNILKGLIINHEDEFYKLKGLRTLASSWNALENIQVSELHLLHEKAPLYPKKQVYSGSCSIQVTVKASVLLIWNV